jgi:hypothetical protein
MQRLTARSITHVLLSALLVLSLAASACSGTSGRGVPPAPGQYEVQKDSIRYDGQHYQLFWTDKDGAVRQMETSNLRLVRDDQRTFLEVPGNGDPILHLREDERITVLGQDHQGPFQSFWFPFLLGQALGGLNRDRVVINQPAPNERGPYDPRTPTYRYPPTDTFGRGDQLHGSVDSSKPEAPDYRKVQPSPYAVSGQAAGTGGGNAATNKSASPGQRMPGDAVPPAGNATSGQSGGTGGGTAASSKGGFLKGSQSFSSKSSGSSGVGAGSNGVLKGGGSSGLPGGSGAGSSGSKGIGGSSGSTGSKGIGGSRMGGSSRGGRR